MPVTECDDCGLQHDASLPHRCAVDELRDAFAMAALTGSLASPMRILVDGKPVETPTPGIVAMLAYDYADACIAERSRRRDTAREGA